MANSLLTSFLTAVGQALPSALAQGNPFSSHATANAALEEYVQELYAFTSDPDQVLKIADGIGLVPNRPLQATFSAVQLRKNANNPSMVLQIAAGLHSYLQTQNSNIITSILGSAPAPLGS